MRLYSKEWVLKVLEELGGEASVEVLRMMSAGLLPCEHVVEDCYFPDLVEGQLSCIEGALEMLRIEGKIEVEGDRVRLSSALQKARARS